MVNQCNDERVQKAVQLFLEGYSCSQSICAAFCEQVDLDREIILRLAAGFSGGIGRQGRTCGALSGAVIILGLFAGSHDHSDKDARDKTHALVRELFSEFADYYGSVDCRDILGLDISTKDGYARAKEQKLFETVCPRFVQSTAILLEEFISRELNNDEIFFSSV